jgi:hypothetical protein
MLKRIIGALCLLTLATPTFAQDRPTGVTRYWVMTDRVKPEMMTEWLTLQKDKVVPALKKAGVTERKVYRTVLGDTTEFISYRPFPDYGEMDGPGRKGGILPRRCRADFTAGSVHPQVRGGNQLLLTVTTIHF